MKYLKNTDALIRFISRLRRRPIPAKTILRVIKDAREENIPVAQLAHKLQALDSKLEVKVFCTGFPRHGLKAYQVEVNERKGDVHLYTGEQQLHNE